MADTRSVALCVFARALEPGRVKTRLTPALGADGALALYSAFVQDVLATCAARPWGERVLWVAGERVDSLSAVAAANGFDARRQPDGELGARMTAGLAAGLGAHDRVLLIGTDLPTLPLAYLELACGYLARHDLVLGPSADGGYYLIGVGTGCEGTVPDVFTSVPWSSPDTLRLTLVAARHLQLNVRVLPPWYDVDGPRDLQCLRAHLRLSPGAAPRTADLLGLGSPAAHF